MKTIALLSSLLVVLGACDSASEPVFTPPVEECSPIAGLKSRCTSTSYPITQDIYIRGVVTANDQFGEYDKSFVIEDASGGIEIAAESKNIHRKFPLGCEVLLACNGLALGDYGGKIQLGAPPQGEYSVDRIPEADLGRYLRRIPGSGLKRQYAVHTFTEISGRHIDTYVRFDGIHFAEISAWCDTDPETGKPLPTERIITDAFGNTFRVRTLGSAHYANEPVPPGTGSLCGVIDYFNGTYSLRIANREFLNFSDAAHPTAYLSVGKYSDQSPTR